MKTKSIIIIISFVLLSILGFLQILVSIDCIVDQAEIGFLFCYAIEYDSEFPDIRPTLDYDIGFLQVTMFGIYFVIISVILTVFFIWKKRKWTLDFW